MIPSILFFALCTIALLTNEFEQTIVTVCALLNEVLWPNIFIYLFLFVLRRSYRRINVRIKNACMLVYVDVCILSFMYVRVFSEPV